MTAHSSAARPSPPAVPGAQALAAGGPPRPDGLLLPDGPRPSDGPARARPGASPPLDATALAALVDLSSDLLLVVAPDFAGPRVRRCSAAAAELLGRDPANLDGVLMLDLVHPDDRVRVLARLARAGEPGATTVVRVGRAGGAWRRMAVAARRVGEEIAVRFRDVHDAERARLLLDGQNEVLALVARGIPLERTLERLAQLVERHVDGVRCAVLLLAEDRRHLVVTAVGSPGAADVALRDGLTVGPRSGSSGTAAYLGTTVIAVDVRRDPRWEELRDGAAAAGLAACWATPVLDSDGAALGTLTVQCGHPRVPGQADLELLDRAASLASVAVRRHRSERQLRHAALHDPLTDLPNRTLLARRLAKARERTERGAGAHGVLYVDIDAFRTVNDSFGHAAGDALLCAVGDRLRTCVRAGGTVARVGGDEFVLLDPAVGSDAALRAWAADVAGLLDQPVLLGGREVYPTASVGAALHVAGSGSDVLGDADLALTEAKSRGHRGLEVYDERLRRRSAAQLNLAGELRRGLARGELVCHYQPVVGLGDGRPVGVEALVRWAHPERGLLPPAAFIPLAEGSGLVGALGRWVLRRACSEVAEVRRTVQGLGDLRVSVNVSVRQLVDDEFVRAVADVLLETGLPAGSLVLEVTESVLLDDGGHNRAVLTALDRLGVRLSLDDFGTGYNSMTYLRELSFDEIKIDRSFVGQVDLDAEARAIVTSVSWLARSLGVSVVAEGVERTEQVDVLSELDVELGQGYLWSHPVEVGALPEVLQRLRAGELGADGPAGVWRVPERSAATNTARARLLP